MVMQLCSFEIRTYSSLASTNLALMRCLVKRSFDFVMDTKSEGNEIVVILLTHGMGNPFHPHDMSNV